MTIDLSQNIRRLRKEKGSTQEQLAAHLNISPQAVGKWERGEGYPDITLLPAISAWFGVSVDELLGVGELRIRERIQDYRDRSHALRHEGRIGENLALWEEAYREFPSDLTVMEQLAEALLSDITLVYGPPPDAEKTARIIALGEEILTRSTDSRQRYSILQTLCYTYSRMGCRDKAVEYAQTLPSWWNARESLLSNILDDEEGLIQKKNNICQLCDMLALEIHGLPGGDMTGEETLECYRFCIDLFSRVFSDGDYGFYAGRLAYYWFLTALTLAEMGEKEKSLDALETMLGFVRYSDARTPLIHTSPMVRGLPDDPMTSTRNYTGTEAEAYRKKLDQWPAFAALGDDERFVRILNSLEGTE